MEVKILQSKNLGFVVAEISQDCGCVDNHFIKNPRMLQMFVSPDETGSNHRLQIQLMTMVYKEILVGDDYITTLPKKDYIDVTEKFDDTVVDMYTKLESKVVINDDQDVKLFED